MSKSKVSKNFISFRQYIRTKDLCVNEQYLLELLFEFHNHSFGYAYPDLKTLMKAFNTTSKNRVIYTIKKYKILCYYDYIVFCVFCAKILERVFFMKKS